MSKDRLSPAWKMSAYCSVQNHCLKVHRGMHWSDVVYMTYSSSGYPACLTLTARSTPSYIMSGAHIFPRARSYEVSHFHGWINFANDFNKAQRWLNIVIRLCAALTWLHIHLSELEVAATVRMKSGTSQVNLKKVTMWRVFFHSFLFLFILK